MNGHPDPDTFAEHLAAGATFYLLGVWHAVKRVQPQYVRGGPWLRLYVETADGRTFLLPKKFLVPAMVP